MRGDFSGFVRTSTGRDLFVQLELPKKKPLKKRQEPVVLIHGLLDSHRRYDAVTARLLAAGHPVLRLDLYGFGRSLTRELEHQGSLDFLREMPFEKSVTDIQDVLKFAAAKFRFSSVRVVGHSMGGGLLAAALMDEEIQKIVRRAILVAPYIYRLERYHAESHLPGFGFFSNPVSRFWERTVSDTMMDLGFFNEAMRDQIQDHVDESEKKALVVSAVASVKGLRDLNVMDLVDDLPEETAVDLIVSTRDDLVPPRFQRKLGARLKERRKSAAVFEIESGHMVPSENPEALFQVILREPRPGINNRRRGDQPPS